MRAANEARGTVGRRAATVRTGGPSRLIRAAVPMGAIVHRAGWERKEKIGANDTLGELPKSVQSYRASKARLDPTSAG